MSVNFGRSCFIPMPGKEPYCTLVWSECSCDSKEISTTRVSLKDATFANLNSVGDRNAIREIACIKVTLQGPDGQDQFRSLDFLLDIRVRDAPNIYLPKTKGLLVFARNVDTKK